MRLAFFLAVSYLRAPRTNRLARLTTVCAILGIAGGVASMIVTQTVARGFHESLQNQILQNTAHINVFRADNTDIADWQDLRQKIERISGVKSVAANSFDNALIMTEKTSSYAVIRGAENLELKVQDLINVEDHRPKTEDPQIIVEIGQDLAQKIGLNAGDAAEIISGGGQIGESFAPVSSQIKIGGTFTTGLYEYDSIWIKVSLETAAKLTNRASPTATVLSVETSDIAKSSEIAAQIQAELGENFKVLDWREANRPLFAALAIERRVILLIIIIVIFIAALNITTTLALIVNERRADIAVLKTCGAQSKTIGQIFVFESLMLSAIAVVGGVVLALSFCFLSNYLGFNKLPADVYSIAQISFEPALSDVLSISLLAFMVSLAAAVVPALVATKQRVIFNLND